jgi:multidrug efflux pump subunit AcrA (membrane-fusion protein)
VSHAAHRASAPTACFGPGLDATQADTFRASERTALAAAARVVVTSEATARIVMAEYDVPFPRISIVRPGKDPVPSALGSNDGVVITIPDSGNLASALCARADIANARSVRLALGTWRDTIVIVDPDVFSSGSLPAASSKPESPRNRRSTNNAPFDDPACVFESKWDGFHL